MTRWNLEEEQSFGRSVLLGWSSRRSRKPYSILLRTVKILENKRLFLSADIVVHCVAIDGYPDLKSGNPFWSQTLRFSGVKDGQKLSIDEELGWIIYRGQPRDFINLHILAIRDTESSRRFAETLKDSFVAEGIGIVAGAATSIFAGPHALITAKAARDLAKKAVNTALDHIIGRKDPVIGMYYGSLLKEYKHGLGYHPKDWQQSALNCGGAMEIVYEVRRG